MVVVVVEVEVGVEVVPSLVDVVVCKYIFVLRPMLGTCWGVLGFGPG